MRSLCSLLVFFLSDGKEPAQPKQRRRLSIPKAPSKPLKPPFPDGLCQGRIVTIPPDETYGIDVHLSGNNIVLPPRPLDVWLPREYDEERYQSTLFPVLFCHDGQDAFLDATSWTGQSWRLLGALTRLSERKLLKTPDSVPPIVVSLRSSESDLLPGIRRRYLEYGDINTPFAEAHVEFVANTVVPCIHNRFRTSSKPEQNFLMGASMGGQACMNILLRYPNLFGGAACLSPSFMPSTIQAVSQHCDSLRGKRLYMDIGGDTEQVKVSWFDVVDHIKPKKWWNPGYWWLDTQLQAGVDAMSRELKGANIDHRYAKIPGGRHNERAWSERIHLPLLHLLGKSS